MMITAVYFQARPEVVFSVLPVRPRPGCAVVYYVNLLGAAAHRPLSLSG